MSFLHVHQVFESNLKSNMKIVAAVIAEMADLDSGEAWPSYDTVARRSSIQRRQAIRTINSLVDMGVLTVVGKRPCGNGYTNVWRVNSKVLDSMRGVTHDTSGLHATGVTHDTPPVSPMTPDGCHFEQGGVSPMTPKPSRTIIEPSRNRHTRRTRRCPKDWQPREKDINTLLNEFPHWSIDDIESAAREMMDHEFGNPRSDWDACFRNWARNNGKRNKPRQSAGQRKVDRTKAAMRDFVNG